MVLWSYEAARERKTWFVKAMQLEMFGDMMCFFFPPHAWPMHSFAWIFSYMENSITVTCRAISWWNKNRVEEAQLKKRKKEANNRIQPHPVPRFFVFQEALQFRWALALLGKDRSWHFNVFAVSQGTLPLQAIELARKEEEKKEESKFKHKHKNIENKEERITTLSRRSFMSCWAADFISIASFCSTNFLKTEISSEFSAQSSKWFSIHALKTLNTLSRVGLIFFSMKRVNWLWFSPGGGPSSNLHAVWRV